MSYLTSLTSYLTLNVMSRSYSIYDAKAQLSKLLKQVKEGKEITITERGTPIARLVPYQKAQTLDERIAEFTVRGVITPAKRKTMPQPDKRLHRPGALERFLKDRHRF